MQLTESTLAKAPLTAFDTKLTMEKGMNDKTLASTSTSRENSLCFLFFFLYEMFMQ